MTAPAFTLLPHRGVIAVSGDDARDFLQGLVSNDVTKVTTDQAVWAAFLTPQGKFLHEFMMAWDGSRFLLECERARADDLATRLNRFRLRAKVTVEAVPDLAVAAVWGDGVARDSGLAGRPGAAAVDGETILMVDPRLAEAGLRLIGPNDALAALATGKGWPQGSKDAFDNHRIRLGLPDGSRDMEVDKALLLENGFEELGGVDFEKGCYIGQELTARTHYRALIKKRLLPVTFDGPPPPPGTELSAGGAEAGIVKSSAGDAGLALIRLAQWRGLPEGKLQSGDVTVTPFVPSWMALPEEN